MKINLIAPKYYIKQRNNSYQTAQNKKINNFISFEGFQCDEKAFEVKNINDLHCPICGLLMLNEKQQRSYMKDVANKKGEALKKALEKYENETEVVKNKENSRNQTIYRGVKQKIVTTLKELALRYPDLDLSELVKLKRKESLNKLIREQLAIFSEIERLIQNSKMNRRERRRILRKLEMYKKMAKDTTNSDFKRKVFIEDIQSEISSYTTRKKIKTIAQKLPSSKTKEDAFFVKYSSEGTTNQDIAWSLISQSIVTAEHLIPKSNSGPNSTENYICDCNDCNSKRSNTPFYVWMKNKEAKFQKGLQQYLYDVQNALKNKIISSKYKDYISDIIDTIAKLSNGEIILKKPEQNSTRISDKTYF